MVCVWLVCDMEGRKAGAGGVRGSCYDGFLHYGSVNFVWNLSRIRRLDLSVR